VQEPWSAQKISFRVEGMAMLLGAFRKLKSVTGILTVLRPLTNYTVRAVLLFSLGRGAIWFSMGHNLRRLRRMARWISNRG